MVDLSRRSMLTGSWRNASNGILPPWARETTYFLAHCLRCDACIQACEADILQRGAGISERRFQTGRVQLLLCLCAGLYRIAFSSAPHQGLGSGFTLTENCLARQSVECHRCQDSCEPMAITFRPTLSGIYQPQLDSQACNGCGACVAICPVSAIKAENHHAH